MFAYYFVFGIISLAYIFSLAYRLERRVFQFIYSFLFVVLLLFIGLRHEVSRDWSAYLFWFKRVQEEGVEVSLQTFFTSDIGYSMLNLVSSKLGTGIYGVNLACAFVFLVGLFAFLAKKLANPFFGLLIAYPYLIMVVANGYTRQAAALGLVFLVYTAILENRPGKAVSLLFIAFTFHKTALFSAWLFFLNRDFTKKRGIITVAFAFLTLAIFAEELQVVFTRFLKLYVENPMTSEGSTLRAMTVLIPALIIIVFSKRLKRSYADHRFWLLASFGVVVLSCFAFIKLTLADRLLLYLYPVQIVGLERAFTVDNSTHWKAFVAVGTLVFSLSFMSTWLLTAVHRDAWVPYKNVLFLLF